MQCKLPSAPCWWSTFGKDMDNWWWNRDWSRLSRSFCVVNHGICSGYGYVLRKTVWIPAFISRSQLSDFDDDCFRCMCFHHWNVAWRSGASSSSLVYLGLSGFAACSAIHVSVSSFYLTVVIHIGTCVVVVFVVVYTQYDKSWQWFISVTQRLASLADWSSHNHSRLYSTWRNSSAVIFSALDVLVAVIAAAYPDYWHPWLPAGYGEHLGTSSFHLFYPMYWTTSWTWFFTVACRVARNKEPGSGFRLGLYLQRLNISLLYWSSLRSLFNVLWKAVPSLFSGSGLIMDIAHGEYILITFHNLGCSCTTNVM